MTSDHVLRALLRSLVLPPGGPLLLMLVGVVSLRRWRRTALAMLWIGLVSLWLLSAPFFADRLERAVENEPALDLARTGTAQAIVILSAGASWAAEYGSDVPDADTLQRLAYGAYVAKRTGLPLLVSGGVVNDAPALALTMRDSLLRDFSTPVKWLEASSQDTHENAVNSAAILKKAQVRRIVLVTSAEHMPRAAAEFRSAGLQVAPAPLGFVSAREPNALAMVPTAAALRRSQRSLYELLGDAVRRLRSDQVSVSKP